GFARRSVFSVRAIKAGEAFTEENIRVLRNGANPPGLPPEEYPRLLGGRAACDIAGGRPVTREMVRLEPHVARGAAERCGAALALGERPGDACELVQPGGDLVRRSRRVARAPARLRRDADLDLRRRRRARRSGALRHLKRGGRDRHHGRAGAPRPRLREGDARPGAPALPRADGGPGDASGVGAHEERRLAPAVPGVRVRSDGFGAAGRRAGRRSRTHRHGIVNGGNFRPEEATMEMIRDEGAKVLEIPLVIKGTSGGSAPARFYQRFASDGRALDPHWPRVTSEDSERLF